MIPVVNKVMRLYAGWALCANMEGVKEVYAERGINTGLGMGIIEDASKETDIFPVVLFLMNKSVTGFAPLQQFKEASAELGRVDENSPLLDDMDWLVKAEKEYSITLTEKICKRCFEVDGEERKFGVSGFIMKCKTCGNMTPLKRPRPKKYIVHELESKLRSRKANSAV
jgi:hypothetical protein